MAGAGAQGSMSGLEKRQAINGNGRADAAPVIAANLIVAVAASASLLRERATEG